MSLLSRISGREAVKAFEKAGWQVARQKGSYKILTKEGSLELDKGTLKKLINLAKITLEEFKNLL